MIQADCRKLFHMKLHAFKGVYRFWVDSCSFWTTGPKISTSSLNKEEIRGETGFLQGWILSPLYVFGISKANLAQVILK